MSIVLYQRAEEVDVDGHTLGGRDCYFVDGNGKKWTLPYDEPTEFANEYMAGKILEHCHYYGIVEVHAQRDRQGVHYDIEDAKRRAKEALEVSMKACINDYVITQLEDRVRKNYPPLPPSGRALECCIVLKYNLLKAGIRCVGWEAPYAMDDPGYGNTVAAFPQSNTMQEQINQLQSTLLNQNALIMELLKGKAPAERKEVVAKAGKVPTPKVTHESESEPEPKVDEYEQDQQVTSIKL